MREFVSQTPLFTYALSRMPWLGPGIGRPPKAFRTELAKGGMERKRKPGKPGGALAPGLQIKLLNQLFLAPLGNEPLGIGRKKQFGEHLAGLFKHLAESNGLIGGEGA